MTLRYLHESITFALSVQILLVCFLLLGIYFLSKRVEVYPLQTGDLHILLSNSYCSHWKGRRTVYFKRYLNLHKLDAVSKVDGYYSNCVKFIANEVSSLSRFVYIVGVFSVIVNCHGHFWKRLLSFNKKKSQMVIIAYHRTIIPEAHKMKHVVTDFLSLKLHVCHINFVTCTHWIRSCGSFNVTKHPASLQAQQQSGALSIIPEHTRQD